MDKPEIAAKAPCIKEMEPGTYFWCACGRSKTQPFCDGSHRGTSISPVAHTVTVKGKVAWCACKHSKKGCLCDGTHKQL
jgi:CDGSH iron-sulfur domain-containing protein 3